ncbi:hypothetical protein NECAME_16851 [Necator americanus]|uniref:Uncharacterized protein n=1 Tax=Necator americanus TaxID=51031 RepID=W2TT24_NECAM|nr:hypothetical protein NECAME_16851 [Necator americanus]ETN85235.1 hypothetical protein NECAME_16851 [Necator americanus]
MNACEKFRAPIAVGPPWFYSHSVMRFALYVHDKTWFMITFDRIPIALQLRGNGLMFLIST